MSSTDCTDTHSPIKVEYEEEKLRQNAHSIDSYLTWHSNDQSLKI